MRHQSTAMQHLLQELCWWATTSACSQAPRFLRRQAPKKVSWAVPVQCMLSTCTINGAKTPRVSMLHGAFTSKTWKVVPPHHLSYRPQLVKTQSLSSSSTCSSPVVVVQALVELPLTPTCFIMFSSHRNWCCLLDHTWLMVTWRQISIPWSFMRHIARIILNMLTNLSFLKLGQSIFSITSNMVSQMLT